MVLAYLPMNASLKMLRQLAVAAFKSNLQSYAELLLFFIVSMTYLNAMEDMQIFDMLKFWLVKKNPSFVALACINIVIATNAGGSYSPLGGMSTLS